MKKKFLITTALEDSWVGTGPVLFLGEWCRLYSRQKEWADMDAEVLPYHWKDRGKFDADYQYIRELYERLLPVLGMQLNQIHGVNNELRYWRILVGPWLAYFIQMLFDRWSSIQQAVSSFEIVGAVVLEGSAEALVPNDLAHLNRLLAGDEWNHFVYASILQGYTSVPCEVTPGNRTAKHLIPKPHVAVRGGVKYAVFTKIAKWARHFSRNQDAVLMSTYLSVFDELKLQLRLGQIPQFWSSPESIREPVDWQQREWSLVGGGDANFEKFLISLIPKQIPTIYLEGYTRLLRQVQTLPWPRQPSLIFTSNVLWFDTLAMAYTGEKVTKGTKLLYGQHGGVYGVAKFTWAEEHEVAIADQYLTWGWSDPTRPKIKPVGIFKPLKQTKRSDLAKRRLILVTQNSSRYNYRLCSEAVDFFENYFENSFRFVNNVPEEIQTEMLVRLGPGGEFGWSQAMRWQDRFPKIEIDTYRLKMTDLLQEARLAVYTYNSTGFLEAFSGGIPAILFWDEIVSPLRASAVPYFEDLKRVGIFHGSSESAAQHVATIWNNVEAWWQSQVVQEALNRFTAVYCRKPANLLDSVEHILREVMVTPEK